LGGCMGSDMRLERFATKVQALITEWFPSLNRSMLHWTADPAGAARNPHGSRSAKDILHDFGIVPLFVPDANSPPRTDYAISYLTGFLERSWYDGSPVFALDPKFLLIAKDGTRTCDEVLVDGFELGLVWDDDRAYGATDYPHIRPWKRDKWFEHPFATLFYAALAFGPVDAAEAVGVLRNTGAIKRARKELLERGATDAEIAEAINGRDR